MNQHASLDEYTWTRAIREAQRYGLSPHNDYYSIIAYAYIKADSGNRQALANAYPLLEVAYNNWYEGGS